MSHPVPQSLHRGLGLLWRLGQMRRDHAPGAGWGVDNLLIDDTNTDNYLIDDSNNDVYVIQDP